MEQSQVIGELQKVSVSADQVGELCDRSLHLGIRTKTATLAANSNAR
ncbi:hypothetical protein [Myxacorys almedinensis]|uniref:Uncharacterized protein n=1 Tax=Myxacorys almedinensis A TaxID=2690445 RepID=A0A8J7Z0C4_9CYAN|nr:hypothetical protein [Myxacorys almedinensis]NDJ17819.1 hypothetical protein [Myxacorys almedinensis A]